MSRSARALAAVACATACAVAVSGPDAEAAPFTPPSTVLAGVDLDATTVPRMEQLMDAGRFDAVALTRFYLHRIAVLNPKLHAVITTNPAQSPKHVPRTVLVLPVISGRCWGSRSW